VLRKRWPEGLRWILIGVWTLALLQLLKLAVARPRPHLWASLIEVGGYSFPSGHALASATLYPLLAHEIGRGRRLAYLIAGLGSVWLGLGRLYLGVHWPSDVLFGWGLGAFQSLAVLRRLKISRIQER
jgi:undecaprenyl-diphosphatase